MLGADLGIITWLEPRCVVGLEEHKAFEYALPGLEALFFSEPLGFSPDS